MPMRPVGAGELFELPQSLEEMASVPDRGAVQKFTSARLTHLSEMGEPPVERTPRLPR